MVGPCRRPPDNIRDNTAGGTPPPEGGSPPRRAGDPPEAGGVPPEGGSPPGGGRDPPEAGGVPPGGGEPPRRGGESRMGVAPPSGTRQRRVHSLAAEGGKKRVTRRVGEAAARRAPPSLAGRAEHRGWLTVAGVISRS